MKKVKRYILENWYWIVLGLVLTRKGIECAYIERGYRAVGGEWMILPILLILVYLVKGTYRSIIDIFVIEEKEDV